MDSPPKTSSARTPRILPLSIQGNINLDEIREASDLDAAVAKVADAARALIFRELVKRDLPALASVPARAASEADQK